MDVSCVSGVIIGSSSGCVASIICGSSTGVLDESFGNVNAAEGCFINVFVGCFLFNLWCFSFGLSFVVFGSCDFWSVDFWMFG